jgi:hypothetical protein
VKPQFKRTRVREHLLLLDPTQTTIIQVVLEALPVLAIVEARPSTRAAENTLGLEVEVTQLEALDQVTSAITMVPEALEQRLPQSTC